MKQLIFFFSLLSICMFTLGQDLNNGLVGYYPFNGNANDLSSKSNNGKIFGAYPTTDRFGNKKSAYYFNGVDNYILIDQKTPTISSTSYSISVWVKYSSQEGGASDYAALFIKAQTEPPYQGICTFIDYPNSGKIGHRAIGNDELYSTFQSNNEWVHLVFIKDEKKLFTYINGEKHSERKTSSFSLNNNSPIFLGCNQTSTISQNYQGSIDELRMYDRPLSDIEIQNLYLENKPLTTISNSTTSSNKNITTVANNKIELNTWYDLTTKEMPRDAKSISIKVDEIKTTLVINGYDEFEREYYGNGYQILQKRKVKFQNPNSGKTSIMYKLDPASRLQMAKFNLIGGSYRGEEIPWGEEMVLDKEKIILYFEPLPLDVEKIEWSGLPSTYIKFWDFTPVSFINYDSYLSSNVEAKIFKKLLKEKFSAAIKFGNSSEIEILLKNQNIDLEGLSNYELETLAANNKFASKVMPQMFKRVDNFTYVEKLLTFYPSEQSQIEQIAYQLTNSQNSQVCREYIRLFPKSSNIAVVNKRLQLAIAYEKQQMLIAEKEKEEKRREEKEYTITYKYQYDEWRYSKSMSDANTLQNCSAYDNGLILYRAGIKIGTASIYKMYCSNNQNKVIISIGNDIFQDFDYSSDIDGFIKRSIKSFVKRYLYEKAYFNW